MCVWVAGPPLPVDRASFSRSWVRLRRDPARPDRQAVISVRKKRSPEARRAQAGVDQADREQIGVDALRRRAIAAWTRPGVPCRARARGG